MVARVKDVKEAVRREGAAFLSKPWTVKHIHGSQSEERLLLSFHQMKSYHDSNVEERCGEANYVC